MLILALLFDRFDDLFGFLVVGALGRLVLLNHSYLPLLCQHSPIYILNFQIYYKTIQ